ncbi:hypothetical protein H0H93_005004 [Arthromyces matolae]|nr:hypothetical protein H0H93_005004 [Arthromyces matolae]
MSKPVCASDNKDVIDQSSFWDSNGIHWDAHRIGWAIAGGFAALAVTLSAFMLLLIEYVAATATDHKAENAIARKDKKSLPIPVRIAIRNRPLQRPSYDEHVHLAAYDSGHSQEASTPTRPSGMQER